VAVGVLYVFRPDRVKAIGVFGLVGLAIFAVVGLLGILDILTMRVSISEEMIEVVNNGRRRTISRSEIESVSWAKGCGVSIKLKDENWLKLPNVFSNYQGAVNTLNAWLKNTGL